MMNDEWPKKSMKREGPLWGPVVWLQSFYFLAKNDRKKCIITEEQKSKRAKEQKPAKASKRGVKIVALLNKKNRQEHICTVKIQKQAQKKTN